MKIRKILIIIVSAIILMLFGLVASTSYNAGVKYGVTNAETIRTEQAKKAETYKKTVKSVLVTKVKNTKIRNQIRSTGRVVSVNNITISSQVQGRLVGNNTFKKGTEIKKGEIIFSVENTDLTLLIKSKKSRFMSLISATMADIKLDFNSEFSKWDVFFNAININSNLIDSSFIYSISILANDSK